MFGSGILDTVIGLIFMFLLVSMLVTIVNEMIAAALMSRAKWLWRGIDRLIGPDWKEKVYAHPLIAGTASGKKSWFANRGPSYIPSRSFANVLMNIVQENAGAIAAIQKDLRTTLEAAAGAGASLESLKAQLSAKAGTMQAAGGEQALVAGALARHLDASRGPNPRAWLGEVDARVQELRSAGRRDIAPVLDVLAQVVRDGLAAKAGVDELRRNFDDAVTSLLTGPATQVLKDELSAMGKRLQGPYTLADAYADIHWFIDGLSARYLRQMLQALPDGKLRTTLLVLFDDARNDVEKFKENIEVWFNNGMDRVNGWYKRRSQLVIAILSLIMAVAMNVDAILIFRHLQTYPAAREALVGQATQFAQKNPVPTPGSLTVANGEAYSGMLPLKPPYDAKTVKLTSDNPGVKLRDESVEVAQGATQVAFIVDVDKGDADQPGKATISSADASGDGTLTLTPSLLKQFDTVQTKLMDMTIPVGWVSKGTPAEIRNGQVLPSGDDAAGAWGQRFLQHGLGWLLTALAATLGAPFWFDMLNRVISIRAAGKPPEEEPKPPKSVSVPVEPGQSQREADRTR